MELTVEKARMAKKDLEDKLLAFLSLAMGQFERDTKLYINSIDVSMSDITCMEDAERRYKVTSVTVNVHL